LNADLVDELEFIDIIAEDNPKNYQVYHHRQRIIEAMAKLGTADFERELQFTQELILADNKNYHVWSYRFHTPSFVRLIGRQWLVKHFDLSASLEVAFTTKLIEEDILNNSAWSHRYYTLFGNGASEETLQKGEEYVDSEVEFTQGIIKKMPSNPAPWNYLRGYPPFTNTV
jgi:protein farnesyltransferase/geranylgeranyltransferase type-1 subunit alpha